MVCYNKKEILYTFKYGGYISKKTKIVLVFIPVFLFLLGLIIYTVLLVNNEKDAWESLVLCFFASVYLMIILFLFLKEKKHDKEILNWLGDDNLYETKATPWVFSNKLIGFANYIKFGVDFEMNGQSYRKISLGYDGFYKSVQNGLITVVYSPKYDQVMVLKD